MKQVNVEFEGKVGPLMAKLVINIVTILLYFNLRYVLNVILYVTEDVITVSPTHF